MDEYHSPRAGLGRRDRGRPHGRRRDEQANDANLKYLQLTAVLVKAVQEQEAKIDALQTEVAALKARLGKN